MAGFDAIGRWAIGKPPTAGFASYSIAAAVGAFVFTGKEITKLYLKLLSVGTFLLSGQVITKGRSILMAVGTFLLSGKAVNLVRGVNLAAAVGTFLLSGKTVAKFYSKLVSKGTFLLTGFSIVKAIVFAVAKGTFVLSGIAQILAHGIVKLYDKARNLAISLMQSRVFPGTLQKTRGSDPTLAGPRSPTLKRNRTDAPSLQNTRSRAPKLGD